MSRDALVQPDLTVRLGVLSAFLLVEAIVQVSSIRLNRVGTIRLESEHQTYCSQTQSIFRTIVGLKCRGVNAWHD